MDHGTPHNPLFSKRYARETGWKLKVQVDSAAETSAEICANFRGNNPDAVLWCDSDRTRIADLRVGADSDRVHVCP